MLFAVLASLWGLDILSIGGNSSGGQCVDCIDYDLNTFRYGTLFDIDRRDRSYYGDSSLDCLGDMPGYIELIEGHVYLADGTDVTYGGGCQGRTTEYSCREFNIRAISGTDRVYTQDIYSSSFTAYKPRQYVGSDLNCAAEIEQLAQSAGVNITETTTIYVCPGGEERFSIDECPEAEVYQQPSFFRRILIKIIGWFT